MVDIEECGGKMERLKDEIMINIEELNNKIFPLADRRELLCKYAPPCPQCGEYKQIQLLVWDETPAIWRCRYCYKKYTFEPQGV